MNNKATISKVWSRCYTLTQAELHNENMTRTIKAILFDLGDTLLDFGEVNLRALFNQGARGAYDYLLKLGHPLPPFARYHSRHLRAVHWNVLKSAIVRREFNTLHVMTRLCRRMGLSLDSKQLLELCWLWYEPLSRRAVVEPGLQDMLQGFINDGLQIALTSNTFVPGEVLDRHLESEKLLDFFPVRVYSCQVGFRKPDPRIFMEALNRLGLQAREAIFVGDSPKSDIRGANRVEMISVLRDRTGRYAQLRYRPTHRIRSILELSSIIAQYDGNNQTPSPGAKE